MLSGPVNTNKPVPGGDGERPVGSLSPSIVLKLKRVGWYQQPNRSPAQGASVLHPDLCSLRGAEVRGEFCDQIQQHRWCCVWTCPQKEQVQNRSCGSFASRPHILRAGQPMPLQHTVPAPPWNGAAHGVPAHVTKEGGDGAIPPSKPPQHVVEESLVNRNRRHPLPLVQWGEEKTSIDCAKDPPQRFQPARIPWQGPRHQPHHRGVARLDHKHSRVSNAASPQPAPHGSPRGIKHGNVSLQLGISLCCRGPSAKVSQQPVPAKLALHLSQ